MSSFIQNTSALTNPRALKMSNLFAEMTTKLAVLPQLVWDNFTFKLDRVERWRILQARKQAWRNRETLKRQKKALECGKKTEQKLRSAIRKYKGKKKPAKALTDLGRQIEKARKLLGESLKTVWGPGTAVTVQWAEYKGTTAAIMRRLKLQLAKQNKQLAAQNKRLKQMRHTVRALEREFLGTKARWVL